MNIALPSILLGPAAAVDRGRAEAVPRPRSRRAVLVGSTDVHVSSLLTDVLREIALDVELLDAETGPPDVILAMVERGDSIRGITDARARFPRIPVVAILTLGTHRLGTRAVAAGAQACYVLDMPLDRLRKLITALLR